MLRYETDGFEKPGGSSFYMEGAESSANNWINLFNPDDVATNQLWRISNLTKAYANVENPEFPPLDGVDVPWNVYNGAYLLAVGAPGPTLTVAAALGWAIETQAHRMLPSAELLPWRYVVDQDSENGHTYWRVPYTEEGDLTTNRDDWLELRFGVDPVNGIGKYDYEIRAFMSQANAETVGNAELDWFGDNGVNTNIRDDLGLEEDDETSPLYAGARQNHSFQFNHDAATTWAFWEHIKGATSFDATY